MRVPEMAQRGAARIGIYAGVAATASLVLAAVVVLAGASTSVTVSTASAPVYGTSSTVTFDLALTSPDELVDPTTATLVYSGGALEICDPDGAWPTSAELTSGTTTLSVSCTTRAEASAGQYALIVTVTDDVSASPPAPGEGTFAIAKAAAACAVSGYSVTYDGTAHTATGACTGVLGETLDGLDVSATTRVDATSATLPWSFADLTGNYEASAGTVEVAIAQAGSLTTLTCPTSVVYAGTALTPCTARVTGAGGLDADLAVAYADNTAAGTATASAAYAGDANHRESSASTTFAIAKAAVACAVSGYSVTYDGTAHTATGACTGVLGETLDGLDVSATTRVDATSATLPWSFADLTGNYEASAGTVEVAILAATLTVTADDATRSYGAPNPAELTFQVSGFVGAEDWTTPPTCATEATEGTHVGAEPIVCTGGDAGTNYAVLRVAGTLTIAKATLAVDAISATKTYGDPDPAFAWGYSGFVAGDETANTGITGAAACARIVADTAVGTLPEAIDCTAGTLTARDYVFVPGARAALEITPRPLTFTFVIAPKTYDRTTTAELVSCAVVGRVGLDDVRCDVTSAIAVFADPNAGSRQVAITNLSLTGGDVANYSAPTDGTTTATIDPAPLTVTATSETRVYDGSTGSSLLPAIAGTLYDDYTSGQAFVSRNVPVGLFGLPIAGGSTIVPFIRIDDGRGGANYAVRLESTAGMIEQRQLQLATVPTTKVYDGSTGTEAAPSLTGSLVDGDSITVAQRYTTPNAGTGILLSLSWTIVDGNDGGNYSLIEVRTARGAITPRALHVSADSTTRTYGEPNPTFTASADFLAGDGWTVPPVCTSDATSGSPVGGYPIACSGGSNANYAPGYTPGTLTVTRRAVTVTASDGTKVYGEADPALGYAVTAGSLVAGDGFTGTPVRVAGENVGRYEITQGTLALSSDYTLTVVAGGLTILSDRLLVVASPATRTYGEPNPTFTSTTVFPDGSGWTVAPVCRSDATSGSPVGGYPIRCSGGVAGNFTPSYSDGILTITQRLARVSVDSTTRTYGDPNPVFTVTAADLLPGDTWTTQPTCTTDASTGSPIGLYAITCTAGAGGNYAPAFTNGTLTIVERVVEVTVSDGTKAYGDPDPALGLRFTVGSLVAGDAFVGSLVRRSGDHVGSYEITAGSLALSANYRLTILPATFTITPRPITVTAPSVSKIYGELDPDLEPVVSGGLVDPAHLTGALARVSGERAGSYAILQGTVEATADYALTFVRGRLTIEPRPLALAAVATSKTEGTGDPTLTYRLVSGTLVRDDQLFGNPVRAAGEAAGIYEITAGTLTAGPNYAITFTPAPFTIVGVSPALPQSISFTGPTAAAIAFPIALSATASSGLAVTFRSETPSVCSISGTTVTPLAIGTCTVRAEQAGSELFLAADPVLRSVTVWDRPRLSSRYFINGEERLSVPIVVIRGTAIEMRLQASPLLPAGTLVEVWYQVGTGAWAKLTSRRVETATGFARYSFRAYKTSVAYRWRLPGSGPLPPVFSAARRIYAR